MAVVFVEGFEKHAPSTFIGNSADLISGGTQFELATQSLLKDWLSFATGGNGGTVYFALGRPQTATSRQIYFQAVGGGQATLRRNIPSALSRGIMGAALFPNQGNAGFTLMDAGTAQLSVYFDSSGRLNVSRGGNAGGNGVGGGTVLFTSGAYAFSNTWHYVELDATIHPSTGHYQVWLDGVSLFNSDSLQNTRQSANSSFNQVEIGVGNTGGCGFDDLYLFDTTGSTCNAQRGDSMVQTSFPTADSSIQFSPAALALGEFARQSTGTNAPGANTLTLVPIVPEVNCTLNSVAFSSQTTSAPAKLKGVVYSDSSNAPGSLLSDGTEVVGVTNGVTVTLPLVTPQSLTGGTRYWIGYYSDTSITLADSETTFNNGQKKANTYGSGAAAGPLSGMTTGQPTWQIWGTATGAASNYALVDRKTIGAFVNLAMIDYVSDATNGHEDLFTMQDLTGGTPASIAAVVVSAQVARDSAGSRLADVRVKSGSTESSGATAGVVLTTTMTQLASAFETDPDTPGTPWTAAGVNAMTAGYRVAV